MEKMFSSKNKYTGKDACVKLKLFLDTKSLFESNLDVF